MVTLADSDWVSGIEAIGREVGLGSTAAYQLILDGSLPVYQLKPGGYYRARRSDLRRWLEQHRVRQVVEAAPALDDAQLKRMRELLPVPEAGDGGG